MTSEEYQSIIDEQVYNLNEKEEPEKRQLAKKKLLCTAYLAPIITYQRCSDWGSYVQRLVKEEIISRSRVQLFQGEQGSFVASIKNN